MIEIRTPTPDQIKDYLGFRPAGIRRISAAFSGDRIVGMAGVVRDPLFYGSILEEDGRWIAFLNTEPMTSSEGRQSVRAIFRYLKELDEEVWVYCENQHETAERLLTILGFQPTDEIRPNWRNHEQKLRMWKWLKPSC